MKRKIFSFLTVFILGLLFTYPQTTRAASLSITEVKTLDYRGVRKTNFSSKEKIGFYIKCHKSSQMGKVQFYYEVKDPTGKQVLYHRGNAIPGNPGYGGSSIKGIPISKFYTSGGTYAFTGKANNISKSMTFSISPDVPTLTPSISLFYPANGSTIPFDSLRFQWSSLDVAKYKVSVDDDRGFSNPLWQGETTQTLIEYARTPTDPRQKLSSGTRYWWKVDGLNHRGEIIYTTREYFSFYISSPKIHDVGITEITTEPVKPVAGEDVKIKVLVENLGGYSESGIQVQLLVNGISLPIKPISFLPLGDQTQIISPSYTIAPTVSKLRVSARVALSSDTNLKNNMKTESTLVESRKKVIRKKLYITEGEATQKIAPKSIAKEIQSIVHNVSSRILKQKTISSFTNRDLFEFGTKRHRGSLVADLPSEITFYNISGGQIGEYRIVEVKGDGVDHRVVVNSEGQLLFNKQKAFEVALIYQFNAARPAFLKLGQEYTTRLNLAQSLWYADKIMYLVRDALVKKFISFESVIVTAAIISENPANAISLSINEIRNFLLEQLPKCMQDFLVFRQSMDDRNTFTKANEEINTLSGVMPYSSYKTAIGDFIESLARIDTLIWLMGRNMEPADLKSQASHMLEIIVDDTAGKILAVASEDPVALLLEICSNYKEITSRMINFYKEKVFNLATYEQQLEKNRTRWGDLFLKEPAINANDTVSLVKLLANIHYLEVSLPSIVKIDRPVQFRITVKNTSQRDIKNLWFCLDIYKGKKPIEETNTGIPGATGKVGRIDFKGEGLDLPIGKSRTFSTSYTFSGEKFDKGTHIFKYRAYEGKPGAGGKPIGGLQERIFQVKLPVIVIKEDASIEIDRGSVKTSYFPGETLRARVKITNTGNIEHNFGVNCKIFRNGKLIETLPLRSVIGLRPGKDDYREFSWNIPQTIGSGTYELKAIVWAGVEWNKPVGPQYDDDPWIFEIKSKTVNAEIEITSPISDHKPGDRFTVSCRIENTGDVSHSFPVGCTVVGPRGYEDNRPLKTKFLYPKRGTTVNFTVDIPKNAREGTYTVRTAVWDHVPKPGEEPYDRSDKDFEVELPKPTKPTVKFTSRIPDRAKLGTKIDIRWEGSDAWDSKDKLEYRYKLDVPGDWIGGLKYILNKWSIWGRIQGITYSDFILKGNYAFSVQCRNSRNAESDIVKKNFKMYFEMPEILEEAITIDWRKVNEAKTQKQKYQILANEYKKAYSMWSQKYDYERRLLKLTTTKEELVKEFFDIIKPDETQLIEWANKGMVISIKKMMLPKTVYNIIKHLGIDVILIYRNFRTNKAATMTIGSYWAWENYEELAQAQGPTVNAKIKITSPIDDKHKPGDSFTVSCRVKNTGDVRHTFPIGCTILGPGHKDDRPYKMRTLYPKRDTTVSFTVKVPRNAKGGTYTVKTAVWDHPKGRELRGPGDSRDPYDRDDKTFTVKKLRVKASIKIISSISQHKPGDSFKVSCRVKNTGDVRHTFPVGCTVVGPRGYEDDIDYQTRELAPRQSATVSFNVRIPRKAREGTYTVRTAVWDHARGRELKGPGGSSKPYDRRDKDFEVKKPIIRASVRIATIKKTRGARVNIEVRVRNTGNIKHTFWVGCSLQKTATRKDYDINPKPITLNARESSSLWFGANIPSGDYKAIAVVWEGYNRVNDKMVHPKYATSTKHFKK